MHSTPCFLQMFLQLSLMPCIYGTSMQGFLLFVLLLFLLIPCLFSFLFCLILTLFKAHVGYLQGSHFIWKTWKNRKCFSSQGNIREFENFAKYQGKIREKLFKNYFFLSCIGLCPFKCPFGRHFGFFYLGWICGVFRWQGTWGNPSFRKEGQGLCLVGLACSWITRREIEPQPTVALRLHLVGLVLTALATCSPCLGEA